MKALRFLSHFVWVKGCKPKKDCIVSYNSFNLA